MMRQVGDKVQIGRLKELYIIRSRLESEVYIDFNLNVIYKK